MEIVDIYDCDRNIIRNGERFELRSNGEYLLAVHNWLIDDTGRILLQKRAACKKYDPNKWGVTGGFARKGETSADACIRETQEEVNISLHLSEMKKVICYSLGNIHYDVWISRITHIDFPLVLQESEVSDAAWITLAELDALDFENGLGMLCGVPVQCQKYLYLPLLKAILNG